MKTLWKLFPVLFLLHLSIIHAQSYLPVQLIYFKYELSDSTVNLFWGTATEVQCYGFNVEKNSSSNWETIGFVPGHGDSNIPWDYSLADTNVIYGNTYLYRLKQIDLNGQFVYSDTLSVSVVTGIKRIRNKFPSNFSVSQNYPNPFNPTTEIKYSLPLSSTVNLKLFNILGRQVKVLVNGIQRAGYYKCQWNAENLASGVYIYVLNANSTDGQTKYQSVKKMVLLK